MITPVLVFCIIIVSYFGYWSSRGMAGYYTSVPMIIAHRGTTTHFPENTNEAYEESVKVGYHSIELDVLCSKDNVIFCSHNYELERETNNGGYIHEINSKEIDNIKTGICSHPNNQKHIPRLEHVAEKIPYNIRLNIEVKFFSPFDFSTISRIRKMILNKEIKQPVLISSFNPFIVFYARWFIPKAKTGYLVETPDMIKWMHLAHPDCLHPRADLLNDKLINDCNKKNISINTWTVNSKSAINYCKSLNIDGIITDRVDALLL